MRSKVFLVFAPVIGGMALATLLGGCHIDFTGDDKKSSGQAPCGAPAGDWQYVSSCDSMFGGVTHQCVDYYATGSVAKSAATSIDAVCSALGGTKLGSLCPAAGSLGSCVNTSSSGPVGGSSAAMLEQEYDYDDTGSAATWEADCESEGGVYVAPDGTAPKLPAGTQTAACNSGETNGGGGTDVFSVSTYFNQEVLECTNYKGAVSEAEFESVAAEGALATPCPSANAICSCAVPASSGLFGTTDTLIYYKTSMSSSSSCPNSDASCVSGYRVP
jgi:hypothetical protein